MSIVFDSDFGILKRTIKDIVKSKKEYLRNNYGINIDDNNGSIYNIIASSLALIEEEVINELNLFFSKMKPGGTYWSEIEKQISSKSTTPSAVKSALLNLDGVEYANIKSSAGKAYIYLIVKEDLLDRGKTNINDFIFKTKIWEILYLTIPSGTLLEGDIEIDGFNSTGQRKSYKISLGKRKYVYMKVKYKLDLKNYLYLNIDSQIRDIYSRIISNNYSDMGISFEYQDFFAPVNEVKGIRSMEIKTCIKDTNTENISSITDSDFKKNEDITINDDTMLIFNTIDRLLIDIDS
ncbi:MULTISPECIES: DUF276 domain-containing protein [Borreliella]|uniref:DUF276 superfamily n=2 Tax=Borreliella TaxID=64895 RepID=C0R8H5_BORVA|nr:MULTISPECIES: DUF276 domain-containing protein [Borreliella]ACK74378.1 conserved hypothetical protein [Borreliella burgdorferi ZS7]ACN52770.1 conserved hypothetical protein [Borreliella valaisiana VS116]EEH31227.1 conserved hypothetical protein [Borreliella burgdorferi Bol26]MCS2182158.1 DUF276 domain-containing protein [Borreliella burgdorferi]